MYINYCVTSLHFCLHTPAAACLTMERKLRSRRSLYVEDPNAKRKLPHVLDRLLEKRVLSDAEVEYVEAERTTMDKVRLLFDTVTRKGSIACETFIDAWETDATASTSTGEPATSSSAYSRGLDVTTFNRILKAIETFTNAELIPLRDKVYRTWSTGATSDTLNRRSLNDQTTLANIITSNYNAMAPHVLDVILARPRELMPPPKVDRLPCMKRCAPSSTQSANVGPFGSLQRELQLYRNEIVALVTDILEDMYAADLQRYVWYYCEGSQFDSDLAKDRPRLARLMLSMVDDDVLVYAQRVYEKLRRCNNNLGADNFERGVFSVCEAV